MKLLCVHPGASVSTHDVYVGLTEALRERGHDIYEYALDARIERAGAWLNYCRDAANKNGEQQFPEITSGQVLYKAGEELVARALRLHDEREPLDAIVVVSAMYLHPDVLVLLRRAGFKVFVLLTESPYDDERQVKILPWLTGAWTNERMTARKMGIPYLQHAYRPSTHTTQDTAPVAAKSHDVVFVGTGFMERIEVLEAVDWTGIDMAIYGEGWELLRDDSPLHAHLHAGAIENEMAAALYRRAKIGLNLYRTSMGFGATAPRVVGAESLNPRAYELAATGCFTISDWRSEVAEVFGAAVPTFSTAEELGALVRRWLADDVGRNAVAAELPRLVHGQTWAARAEQVEADVLAHCREHAEVVHGSVSR